MVSALLLFWYKLLLLPSPRLFIRSYEQKQNSSFRKGMNRLNKSKYDRYMATLGVATHIGSGVRGSR